MACKAGLGFAKAVRASSDGVGRDAQRAIEIRLQDVNFGDRFQQASNQPSKTLFGIRWNSRGT